MLRPCLGSVWNAPCILNTSWIVFVNLMGIIWSEDCIERVFVYFCVILYSVDLWPYLRPRDISRFGIYPYRLYYTCRDIISMDASFYSILPSKVKISLFRLNGQPIIWCNLCFNRFKNIFDFTTYSLWQRLCGGGRTSLPLLHFSLNFIFLSIGIVGLWNH